MKKLIISAVVIATLCTGIPAFAMGSVHYNGTYANTGIVREVNDGEVVIEMQNGNIFAFKDTADDWYINDIASVIFKDMGTPEVYDDEIVYAQYSGWVSDIEAENWVK